MRNSPVRVLREICSMPYNCVAVNCSGNTPDDVSLHKFPSDRSLHAEWTRFVRSKRAMWQPTSNSRLCSDHFHEDCFRLGFSLKEQFGMQKNRRLLRQDAVPSIHKTMTPRSGPLPNIYARPVQPTYRKRKRTAFEKRERKRVVNKLMQQLEESNMPVITVEHNNPIAVFNEEISVTTAESSYQQVFSSEDTLREVTEALLLLSQAPSSEDSERNSSSEDSERNSSSEDSKKNSSSEDNSEVNSSSEDNSEVNSSSEDNSEVNSSSESNSSQTRTISSVTSTDQPYTARTTLRTKACQTSKKDGIHRRSVRVQTRPQVKSKGTGTERVEMVSTGVQCSLLQAPSDSAVEEENSSCGTNQFVDSEESDPTWKPGAEEAESEEDASESHQPVNERKFIVFESQLKILFMTCPACCSVTKTERRCKGTLLTIFQDCKSCYFKRSWTSQPFIGNIPAGNILLSAAVLFSGSLPSKVFTMFRHLGLISINSRTFFIHQRQILHPTIEKIWKLEQEGRFETIQQTNTELVVGGDGRADTPGHSAKFGSYSMVDLNTDKVLHVELVQSNEVKNSNAMEKEGLIRSVKYLEDRGMAVGTLVTDRHPQIQKYVRESMPRTTHYYDVWHIAKGLRKKLEALSKEKDCEALVPWIRSIVNHLYWCSASTPAGEIDLIVDKWRSVVNHVQNIHVGHGRSFDKCLHPLEGADAPKRKWLKSGTKVAEKLGLVLERAHLLRDIKKLSPQYKTSSVETFHRVIISFAPKMIAFSYMGMLSRLYLSALHFNENGSRAQVLDADGLPKFSVNYIKYKKGQHVVKKVTADPTYVYVDRLLEEVCHQTTLPVKERASQDHVVVPPALTSDFPRVEKTFAIKNHQSRFKK